MRIVVFGLTISSSWGNGHATFWRGLCRALAGRGHSVAFFEKDVPYYAAHRDLVAPDGCQLRLYSEWNAVRGEAVRAVRSADLALLTSYCPDTQAAADVVLGESGGVRAFYDLDTGVTLGRWIAGDAVAYLPQQPLSELISCSATPAAARSRCCSTRLVRGTSRRSLAVSIPTRIVGSPSTVR